MENLSGVVSLHPCLYFSSFIQSFFAFLFLFLVSLFSSRFCLCASSLVVIFFFSSRLWLQSFNISSGTHECRLIFGLPRTGVGNLFEWRAK